MKGVSAKLWAVFHELQFVGVVFSIFCGGVISQTRFGTNQGNQFNRALALFPHKNSFKNGQPSTGLEPVTPTLPW
jgi:hypothetical protein